MKKALAFRAFCQIEVSETGVLRAYFSGSRGPLRAAFRVFFVRCIMVASVQVARVAMQQKTQYFSGSASRRTFQRIHILRHSRGWFGAMRQGVLYARVIPARAVDNSPYSWWFSHSFTLSAFETP